MGTVVFPYAPVKIFLTARAEVRAKRRFDELTERGLKVDYSKILEEIKQRDEADAHRAIAPLKQAADAVLVDSSEKTIDEVVEEIVTTARRIVHA